MHMSESVSLFNTSFSVFFLMKLQRHFQADTLPWIQRMQQKEQVLQRRLLRVCFYQLLKLAVVIFIEECLEFDKPLGCVGYQQIQPFKIGIRTFSFKLG